MNTTSHKPNNWQALHVDIGQERGDVKLKCFKILYTAACIFLCVQKLQTVQILIASAGVNTHLS